MKKCFNVVHEKVSYLLHVMLFYAFRVFPIKRKKIIVSNFAGKGYGDNPKYICDTLLSQNQYDIVWEMADLGDSVPDGIRKVRSGSVKYIFEMVTAKVWIDNSRKNRYVRKRKGQYYLQTWHAPFSPKYIEAEAENKLPREYIVGSIRDGRNIDAIVVDGITQEKQFRRVFYLNPYVEFLRIGLPRFDYLYNNKNNSQLIHKLRVKYGFSDEDFVVLYAPTFRDNYRMDAYCFAIDEINMAFRKRFKKECKTIVRLHPNVAQMASEYIYGKYIINGSEHSDMQELSLLSNAVITDYSTSFFDFIILNKPVFRYSVDIEIYKKERGLHKEYFELPFPLARSITELIISILNYDEKSYKNNVEEYMQKNPIYDNGKASEYCAKWIEGKVQRG